jgi:CRP-like cAMP-binding protein
MAYRYKLLPGGRRQILGYLIPGDICDTHFLLFNQPDHCLALASDSLVAKVPLRAILVVVARYPRIERAFMLAALLEHAIMREWLLNMGQRNARQGLGHFLCEMHLRAAAVGLVAPDGSVALPINQAALADTIGQTPVHVNRTLQRLRKDNLILLRQRRLTILDPCRLAEESGFDAQYLRSLHMCG